VRPVGFGEPEVIQPVHQRLEHPGEMQAGPPASTPMRRTLPFAAAGLLRFWVLRLRGHAVVSPIR
jgi:hypothetical protein